MKNGKEKQEITQVVLDSIFKLAHACAEDAPTIQIFTVTLAHEIRELAKTLEQSAGVQLEEVKRIGFIR